MENMANNNKNIFLWTLYLIVTFNKLAYLDIPKNKFWLLFISIKKYKLLLKINIQILSKFLQVAIEYRKGWKLGFFIDSCHSKKPNPSRNNNPKIQP